MSPNLVAVLGIAGMFLLMIMRMPIAFAMFLAGFVGFSYMTSLQAAYSIVSTEIWFGFASYGLSVIPLFVFMGQIFFRSGATEKLYNAAYKWIGHLKGGMASTTILASTVFSTICGSNMATVATMGTIALPEMKKYGYDKALSAGSVATGGTLGVIIPPSVVLLIIALQTEQSIARLFIASIVPGLLLSLLFLFTVSIICWKNPAYGPAAPKTGWKERLYSLPGVIESLVLFLIVIGGLYAGWFTPTEAAAIGAFGALLISMVRRQLTWETFCLAVTDTLRISAMVIMLVIGAVVFGRFLAVTRMPFALAEWAAGLAVPPLVILIVIVIVYIIGGMLMDALGFLTISIPIFFPLAMALGFDPIWYTILIAIITSMGAITPPVGVSAFIVNGLAPDITLPTVFKGIAYFLVAYIVCIILLIVFPQIVLFLPKMMF